MVALTVLVARLITDTESPLLLVTGWETSQVLFLRYSATAATLSLLA